MTVMTAAAPPAISAWRPTIFLPGMHDLPASAALVALRRDPSIRVCDTLLAQIDDLLQSRHPAMLDSERAVRARQLEDALSSWVHYPWSNILLRTLPPAELREARLARNRDKITAAEQACLAGADIAIVGLSVGRSILRTLVMEGIGGRFRLADGDTLALSNLNRLPATLADLGQSKAVLAARELFEIDPYLDIEIFPDGVDPRALDGFLCHGGRLPDLVIEECDSIAVKIQLRRRLRELGIPVLMESSIRGTLDIERFDHEPMRPLLHGLLEDIDPGAVIDLPAVKALIARILPHMTSRMRVSIDQVGSTLRSWPQLASEIALGAATVTAAARAILLGQPIRSGRYIIDLDHIVRSPMPLVSSRTPVYLDPFHVITESGERVCD